MSEFESRPVIDLVHSSLPPFHGMRSVQEAALFMISSDLDAGYNFATNGYEVDLMDRAHILGVRLRQAIEPVWRSAQFDALLLRTQSTIPDKVCAGLEKPTAAVLAEAMNEAGLSGWEARTDVLRGDTTFAHGWLVNEESGIILDIAADRLDFLPIRVLDTSWVRAMTYSDGTPIAEDLPIPVALADAKDDLVKVISAVIEEYPVAEDSAEDAFEQVF